MKEIPEQMKRDNWTFYVLSRSNDPSVMIPNTRKLVSNLIQATKILDPETPGLPQIIMDLSECLKIANDAWYSYSEEKNWGIAMQDCERVLDKIGYLLYDENWAIMQKDSFVVPTKK